MTAGVVLLVWTSVVFLDRPFAALFSRNLYGSPLQRFLAALLSPARFLIVAALLLLAVAGALRVFRHAVPTRLGTPLLASMSVICSLIAVLSFKAVFGRSALDPWYVKHAIYTFRWFHPGWAYDSFPSGTITVATALLTSLCSRHKRLVLPSLALIVLLMAGILATGTHWLSDVIAGTYLGFVMSLLAVRLQPLLTGRSAE